MVAQHIQAMNISTCASTTSPSYGRDVDMEHTHTRKKWRICIYRSKRALSAALSSIDSATIIHQQAYYTLNLASCTFQGFSSTCWPTSTVRIDPFNLGFFRALHHGEFVPFLAAFIWSLQLFTDYYWRK